MFKTHFSKITAAACISAVVFFVGGFSLGIYVNDTGKLPASIATALGQNDVPPSNVDLTPVWRTWNTLNDRFVPASTTVKVSEQEKVWGMIEGLANSLGDPYTVFLPPEENKVFQEDISGSFEGVGMEIGIREGVLTVITPIKGSPALRAGLSSGDKILKIDGASTDGIAVDKAVKLIRGTHGTVVRFTVARESQNELLEIPVTRDVIQIPTIETKKEGDVFVIELYSFSATSPNLFRSALREFIVSGTPKLVLDLRGNPGGYLEAAVDMASWFLPTGKVVVSEDMGTNGETKVHRSRGYNIFNQNLKMAVLVNGGSASASEILAGALQEHGVAKLIGEKTFGKGSVQELVNISKGSSLKVTIARWLTPNGRSISEHGLDPDIIAARTQDDLKEGSDPQLDAAIKYLDANERVGGTN